MSKTLSLTQLGDTKTLAITSGIGPTGTTGPTGADGGLATVQSASFNAENDKIYHVVASATVTDPSPVQGKGYTVFVRNGTATVGGTDYTATATYNPYIIRTYHSGSWKTVVFQNKAAADAAYAAASHTHVSADITDSTNDGDANDDKLLKTDRGKLIVGELINRDNMSHGSSSIYALLRAAGLTAIRQHDRPDASGTYALTSQTDGSITESDVAGLTTALSGKADSTHSHNPQDITITEQNAHLRESLVTYIRQAGLWKNCAIVPMNSRENIAGASLAVLGGLCGNQAALAGGYTRADGGTRFDSTSESYLEIPNLSAFTKLTVIESMARAHESEADSGINDFAFSFGSSATANRIGVFNSTGATAGETIALGFENGSSGRLGASGAEWAQGANTVQGFQFSDSGSKLYIDGSEITLNLAFTITTGTDTSPAATGYTTDNKLWIANRYGTSSSNGFLGLMRYLLVFNVDLTAAQHLAIANILKGDASPEEQSLVMWGDSLTETKHLGYTDSAATIRITPPAIRFFAEYNVESIGQGVSGETAAQIATRATASSTYNDRIVVIWAGSNDEDDADESGVVDEIESIVTHIGHARYVVVTPLVKDSWTGTQKANIAAIRTEIIARFPDNYLDAWAVDNTTSGTPDSGFRRYQSAGVEDDFHPNDDWYDGYIAALNTFITSKGWL